MKNKAGNTSKEKAQQLLMAVGSETTEDNKQVEATEYNWHQPHPFDKTQRIKLDNFAKKTAAAMAKKFAALCHNKFDVTITSTTYHFAEGLVSEFLDSQNNDIYLTFSPGNTPVSQIKSKESAIPSCGLVGMPLKTAITWTSQMLGDTKFEEKPDRELSQLEESLLLDMTSAVIGAFSASHDDYNFTASAKLSKGPLPFEVEGTEEFCKINFRVGKVDSEDSSDAYYLIFCDKLGPIIGKIAQIEQQLATDEGSKAILNHIQDIPVTVTTKLSTTMFAFEELMGLRANDTLLLNRKTNEPLELIVEGNPAFKGQLAKSSGRYAMIITEAVQNTE